MHFPSPTLAVAIALAAAAASVTPTSTAFAPPLSHSRTVVTQHHLSFNDNNDNDSNLNLNNIVQNAAKQMAAALVIGSTFWAAPAALNTVMPMSSMTMSVANAKEMASGSGSRVNKDADSLLQYGLPINNKEVRKIQATIETINTDIGSKRKAAALDGVKKTRQLLNDKNAGALTKSCRDASVCQDLVASAAKSLDPLEASLKESMDAFTGSEQERTALDAAYATQKGLARQIGALEEQMVPAGYKAFVPDEYSDLPQLQGRATVEMSFKKADGAPFDINGVNFPLAKMVMVIDGYVSPITGGNFVDLVEKGFYNNMLIQRSDGFVVQTGDPEGEADGYVGKPGKTLGAGKHGERLIPLEITVKGDKGPTYESTIEELGRGGEATVLPFSSYGAMGWAREEYDPNTGSSQFFWLLFDSDLTPAGKNLLDGNYPCFGYVVEGADFLSDVKEGDIITSAKVTQGIENFKKGAE